MREALHRSKKMLDPHASAIAAISTPPGKGGVALIRISGEDAVSVAARCFRPRNDRSLYTCPARTAIYGDICDRDGRVLDDGIATLFYAPHSYTGENTVEITCHGGILISRRVLEAVFAAGARPAEAGEFTRRALLSGRMTLTEAEGVGLLLEARSDAQLRLSSPSARTKLAAAIEGLHEELLRLVGNLRVVIDYPEEDLADIGREELLTRLDAWLTEATLLAATYRTGRAVSEGIPTVLCGSPNVGKSSLYNLLANEDLAIVTAHAGTTRDVLETDIALGKVMLRVSDTAGLRDSTDPVEQIGVQRSRSRIKNSELILAVFDGSRHLTEDDRALIASLRDLSATVIICINKSDLPTQIEEEAFSAFPYRIRLSALNGVGRDDLTRLVEQLFTDGNISLGEEAIIASARQNAALTGAISLVRQAAEAGRAGYPEDLLSSDLELALGALSELDGRAVSEEVVSEIFSHFCVGK